MVLLLLFLLLFAPRRFQPCRRLPPGLPPRRPLPAPPLRRVLTHPARRPRLQPRLRRLACLPRERFRRFQSPPRRPALPGWKIGRASCRERVGVGGVAGV